MINDDDNDDGDDDDDGNDDNDSFPNPAANLPQRCQRKQMQRRGGGEVDNHHLIQACPSGAPAAKIRGLSCTMFDFVQLNRN